MRKVREPNMMVMCCCGDVRVLWTSKLEENERNRSLQYSLESKNLLLIRSSSSRQSIHQFQTGARIYIQGALGPDRTACLGSASGTVHALRTSHGSLQASFSSCLFQQLLPRLKRSGGS
jgi:hypothetical protein